MFERIIALSGVVVALLAAGCAPTQGRKASPIANTAATPLVFPEPPDPARFYFERTIADVEDVEGVRADAGIKEMMIGRRDVPRGMTKPYAVAVHKGRIFVSDTVERAIHVFDVPRSAYWRIDGADKGSFGRPLGLAVDSEGNLYVADIERRGVFVFDRDGHYLRTIGGSLKDFERLTSVAVDSERNRLYAVDIGGVQSDRHRVRVYDSRTGEHLSDIGRRGIEKGLFNLPRDVAIGKDGRLYVVDGGNFRVQVFDASGKFLFAFGKVGKQVGDFSRPKEIAADRDGNIYVADAAFGNFQVFGPEGEILMFVGARSESPGPAKYMLPSGIFVDEDGRVYMVDQWFRKIDVYRPAALPEGRGFLSLREPPPGGADRTSQGLGASAGRNEAR